MKFKNRMLSAILAAVLAFPMILGNGSIALANENKNTSVNTDIIFEADEVSGTSASSLDALFSKAEVGVHSFAIENETKLTDIQTIFANETLVFKGILTKSGQQYVLESTGNIYKNEKTENAAIYDTLILTEMSDSENVHFVQLKIDKEKMCIGLILQMTDTKELIKFEFPIDDSLFDSIYNSHENLINGEELEKKIVKLYSVSRNLIDKQETFDEAELVSEEASISSITNSLKGTRYGWKTLIDDLNRYGTVKLVVV